MARCKHDSGNVQQFTEICLDCGHSIYETDEEYAKSVRQEIASLRAEKRSKIISELEDERDALRRELNKDSNDEGNSGGW